MKPKRIHVVCALFYIGDAKCVEKFTNSLVDGVFFRVAEMRFKLDFSVNAKPDLG